MMHVSQAAPKRLQEEGVYVAVAGTYLGLASGATISWLVARDVLDVATWKSECGWNSSSLV